MSAPILYYIRHGLTDWNVAGRLQGQHDIPINAEGRGQAVRCGEILRTLLAEAGQQAADCGYASSPLGRARETMGLVRTALGLAADAFATDARLAEIAFGDWEGLTYADVLTRDPDVVTRRESDKWEFRSPGGETYAEVAARTGAWYASLDRDTVVTAHGGTARALIAAIGLEPPDVAVHHPIEQGVVYVFAAGRLTRHD